MIRNKWIALPLILLTFAMFVSAQSPYTINVYGVLGPNYWGTSSIYNTFVNDTINGIKTDEAAWKSLAAVSVIQPNQPIVSQGFESWQGTLDPGSGQYGTDLYFVLHITANNASFSLSELSYHGTTPDPSTVDYTYEAASYANDLRGYNGASVINSGAATQSVTELIYIGEFVGWTATGGTQADLNSVAAYLAGFSGQFATGKYTLTILPTDSIAKDAVYSGQADVQFAAGIPEPGTIALAAMGIAAMLFARRKR
jgi:hypothetical protein